MNELFKVMVFGTFDVFHKGHEWFIQKAFKEAQKNAQKAEQVMLQIVVARDVTVRKIKPLLRNPEEQRRKVLQEAFPEYQVVLGHESDPMKVIHAFQPDMICLGYDQKGFSQQMMNEFPEIQVVRLPSFHPEKYKSSIVGR